MFKKYSLVALLMFSSAVMANNQDGNANGNGTIVDTSTVVNANPSASVNFGPKVNSNNTNNTNLNQLNNDLNFRNIGNSHNDMGQSQNASSNQDQTQDQTQDQNQSQNASSNQGQNQQANNAGNIQGVSFNTRVPHNTPGLGSIFGTPTAPCALPVGGGGVGVGFGFNVMTAYVNQECVKQETVKLAFSLGKSSTADEIFCTMEHAKDTTECLVMNDRTAKAKTEYLANRQPADIIRVSSPSQYDSQQQLTTNDENIKRGLFGLKWDEAGNQWVF